MPNPIFDALVIELRRPKDDRDMSAIAAFLDTVATGPGTTALTLFETLSATKDHLARVSHGQYDPRLVDNETWPGVIQFLGYLREAAQRAEEPQGKESE